MKTLIRTALLVAFLPLSVSGCLTQLATAMQQDNVLVSEVVSICGAIVGGQAEQRINDEWSKYPDASANRPLIENVANVLLTNPEATEQQRTNQYQQYLTCATGLMVTNKVTQ